MDIFGIIWFLFAVVIVIVPAVSEAKRKKKAASAGPSMHPRVPESAVRNLPKASRKPVSEALPDEGVPSVRPVSSVRSAQAVPSVTSVWSGEGAGPEGGIPFQGDLTASRAGNGGKEKIVRNLKDLVVYSEIMKPKFDDMN